MWSSETSLWCVAHLSKGHQKVSYCMRNTGLSTLLGADRVALPLAPDVRLTNRFQALESETEEGIDSN